MKKIIQAVCVAIGVIAVDQLSKGYIKNSSPENFVCNNGMCFGIASTVSRLGYMLQTMLIAICIMIVSMYAYRLYCKKLSKKLELIPYALLIGGAIGNFIDRCICGFVIDFIAVQVKIGVWVYYFPWFNVGDVAIVIGVLWLLYDSFTAT